MKVLRRLLVLASAIGMTSMVSAQTKFMVMTDMHVLDQSLFDDGIAFQALLAEDAKLAGESQALFDKAIERVKADKPALLFIPGDLTNNGEKVSHEHVYIKLNELVEMGIKVYVVPGNHDIDNPVAKSYIGESAEKVASISEGDFKKFYYNCGYSEAVADTGLSYMVYPTDKLALICLDSRKPDTSTEHYSEGGITEDLLKWAEKKAAEAYSEGRTVIGMMHHPIMRHYTGHEEFNPTSIANLSEGYPSLDSLQSRFAAAGIGTVFTGHYHLQSIQHETTPNGELWDVMTGSLSQFPMPMRKGEFLDGGVIKLETINDIPTSDQLMLGQISNQVTTNILFYAMASKIQEKMTPFLSNPLLGSLLTGVPTESSQMVAIMKKHMLEPYTTMLNELANGDEDQNNPAEKVAACNAGYEAFMTEMFENVNASLKPTFETLVQGYVEKVTAIQNSIFYNYKDTPTNVVADNVNSIHSLSPFVTPGGSDVKVVLSDSENAGTCYDLNGRIIDNPQRGVVYIQNGKKHYIKK